MLLEKSIQAGEIITLKIMSGEEVIGKLVSEGDDYFEVTRPTVTQLTQQGVIMIPYVFSLNSDKTIRIAKSAVIISAVTEKEFADGYIQNTTGLSLASG